MKQETWVGEKTVIWVLWHFSSDLWLQLNTCGEFSVSAFWILNSAQICCGIFKEPLYTLELFFYNIDDWNKTKHLRKDKSNGNDYDKKSMKLLMTMAMTLKILSMMMIVMSIIIGDLYIIGAVCLSVCHEKWSFCPTEPSRTFRNLLEPSGTF